MYLRSGKKEYNAFILFVKIIFFLVCYNCAMQTVRIIILVLVVLYLLLAFIFMHISISFTKQIKKSKETIYSLFASQIALFAMIDKELGLPNENEALMNDLLEKRQFTELNKLAADKERAIQEVAHETKKQSEHTEQLLQGLSENVVLIRNEIYRHNKLVENINVNADSVIFSLFVVILRLKRLNKI